MWKRDKTYNRPLGQATHRYPTRNIIQQVHRKPIKETRTQFDEPQINENIPPSLSMQLLTTIEERWISNHLNMELK